MWKVLGKTGAVAATGILAALVLTSGPAHAQQTLTQNVSSGFSLPGVSLPQGHDEVRAADGTTCRSAISGNGAYLDVGVIGNPNDTEAETMSSYGRLVIPLSSNRKRLDCTKLYDLEVERLQIELRLMQMGLSRGVTPPSETGPGGEAEEVLAGSPRGGVGQAGEAEVAQDQKVEKITASDDNWDEEGWSQEGRS